MLKKGTEKFNKLRKLTMKNLTVRNLQRHFKKAKVDDKKQTFLCQLFTCFTACLYRSKHAVQ